MERYHNHHRQRLGTTENTPDLAAAAAVFVDVRHAFAETNTVEWQMAWKSIDLSTRAYYEHPYEHPEATHFLSEFLHRITSVMLDKRVDEMEESERAGVIRTLAAAANALPLVLRDDRCHGSPESLLTLVALLDESRVLYRGTRGASPTTCGIPEQRAKLCMQLVTNGGLAAASVFLENQASRLDHQAKKRAEAKATATISARRARIARAKAGLDTDASISDLCHSVASASSAKALEVVRAATLASEAAAASVASSAVNCERWIGAHPLSILLAGLTDGDAFPPARRNSGVNIVKRTCAAIMSQVRVLSKEELEEEHHESLEKLVRQLNQILVPMGERHMREVFEFHAQLVLRHLRVSSLSMRLWGWGQTKELVSLGRRHRWDAKAYLVEGAGTPFCNSIYRVSPEEAGNVPLSAYREFAVDGLTARSDRSEDRASPEGGAEGSPGENPPDSPGKSPTYTSQVSTGDPTMTLLRCKVDNQAGTWRWVIRTAREADCYYQGPFTDAGDEVFPSRTGWKTASATGTGAAKGMDPPPIVTAVASEGYLCPPGEEHSSLEWRLAKWTVKNKLLEDIFGDNVHVEVVNRSAPLLQFVSGLHGALAPRHIALMWRACVAQKASDPQAVLLKLLSRLVESMDPKLVVYLLGTLRKCADVDAGGPGEARVLAFVECFESKQDHTLLTRVEAVCSATQELMWSLVLRQNMHPAVTSLLTNILRKPTSLARRSRSYWNDQSFLQQCAKFLRLYSRRAAEGGSLGQQEEAAVSSSLELARVLESFWTESEESEQRDSRVQETFPSWFASADTMQGFDGVAREHQQQARAIARLQVELEQAKAELNLERTARISLQAKVERQRTCVVCMEKERDTVLLPCKHLCLCSDCSELAKCPLCRRTVDESIRIFSS